MAVVETEIADLVATVTFDRPPVNALDQRALEEITAAFEAFDDDRRVSVAVFRTGGERAFIAGADLKEIDGGREPALSEVVDRGGPVRRMLEAVANCAVPVIAAVDGAAIGGGLGLVACCDIVVAAESARFGATEINVGVLGAAAHLRRMVGPIRAREMYLTGRLVGAREMYGYGGIAHVVADEELDAAVRGLAAELAAKSPFALRLAKEAMDRTEHLPMHEAYRVEQDYTNRLLGFEDSAEARRAFLERRTPTWRWR